MPVGSGPARAPQRILAKTTALAAAFAITIALAGCSLMGPRQDLGDLVDTTEGLISTTESDLPAIAAALDATVTDAKVMNTPQGTNMGGTELDAFITVAVEMSGPLATQTDLERVLTTMGYTDVLGSQFPDDPEVPEASAVSTDGKTRISINCGVFYRNTDAERTGFNVYFSPVDPVNVKRSEFEKYRSDYTWTVDVDGINARR